MEIREHVPLASFTTLGVGGEARFFAEPRSLEDVQEAAAFARARDLPLFVLGGGSNVVVSDEGFSGLVLRMRSTQLSTEERGDMVFVTAGAGMVWDDFVVYAIKHNLFGIECLSGVPGTVGGAVVANLGAYGAQASDTFVRADVLDTRSGEPALKVFENEQCDFSYHDSFFSREPGRYIIIRATFALSRDAGAIPAYRDNRFDMTSLAVSLGRAPTQSEVRAEVLRMREEKGSLIMPGRISFKSAGSFFHMPFVSEEQYALVAAKAQEIDAAKEERLRPWAWRQKNGSYKVAPGFLLEYTEFKKGYVRGDVGISPRHTLSIINVGEGSARDIAALARDMQDAVEKIFGIRLEREVEYIGTIEG
ncbi:MAG: UDP-N-acetylmuramate dehydrogenase [Candidatus Pacebacteria bacterium]|nr:UDP-N-acetylmuramate dehydrogenase [Candidatus Paceibacterota bacterium]